LYIAVKEVLGEDEYKKLLKYHKENWNKLWKGYYYERMALKLGLLATKGEELHKVVDGLFDTME